MRINTMNLGIVIGIASALAACQGSDGAQPAADEATGDAGGSAGKAGAGGASGNAGTAGSGDTGGSSGEAGSAGSGAEKCIPGLVNDCHCANGDDGVQTCKGDGTFEACKCEGGTGGTSGTGGSAGSSGGSGGLPGCVPGESKDCRCLDLSDGTQQCASDGKSYGLCVCPDGTGGTSGSGGTPSDGGSAGSTGGSAGEPGDGMVDQEITFTLPSNVPSLKGVALFGVIYDPVLNQYQHIDGGPGGFESWCDSNSPTPAEVLVQNGNTFTCTRALPAGKKPVVNLNVEATGGYVFPSNSANNWACYGVGMSCDSASCWAAYGTVKVNGTLLTVPADATDNGQHGCNYTFDVK